MDRENTPIRSLRPSSLATVLDIKAEDRLWKGVMDECMGRRVWNDKAKTLCGEERSECRPIVKVCATVELSRKECEQAPSLKVLGRRPSVVG